MKTVLINDTKCKNYTTKYGMDNLGHLQKKRWKRKGIQNRNSFLHWYTLLCDNILRAIFYASL